MITKLLLSTLLFGFSFAPHVPWVETDVAHLAPEGLLHQEVLRIDPDFGKGHHDIVVDSWMPADAPQTLSEVRMWWLHSQENDERSPFGKGVRRFVDLEYERKDVRRFGVTLRGDRKEWSFDVVLRDGGRAVAIADVTTSDGSVIPQCEAESAKLLVRRVMGIPAGLRGLEVICHDAEGKQHRGTLPEHKRKRR
ncbi:hypothetical protein [Paraliomyxa miuraensis]|uniref:hypothetical protein n=1 Tax=Paraliomyxa miuraensis TaxID=376150 RepID=UPI00225B26A5|nr:hypothetical protein [Paraliomyxa miuraensis]MCX4240242.1 hypothetical protein [Paraliomyxa miuraensis]